MSFFMELADYLAAGATLLGGYGAGRLRGPRPRTLARAVAECACGHGYGQHEGDGEGCRGDSKRADGWDLYGRPDHWTYIKCTCMKYDGPDPEMVRLLLDS